MLRITTSDGAERSFALKPMSSRTISPEMVRCNDWISTSRSSPGGRGDRGGPLTRTTRTRATDDDAARLRRALVQVDRVFTKSARVSWQGEPGHFFGRVRHGGHAVFGKGRPSAGANSNCATGDGEEYSHEVSTPASGRGAASATRRYTRTLSPPAVQRYPASPGSLIQRRSASSCCRPEAVRTAGNRTRRSLSSDHYERPPSCTLDAPRSTEARSS